MVGVDKLEAYQHTGWRLPNCSCSMKTSGVYILSCNVPHWQLMHADTGMSKETCFGRPYVACTARYSKQSMVQVTGALWAG